MKGSQRHDRHKQNRQSDDKEAGVSIAAGDDERSSADGEHDTELKGDAGIGGWEEQIDRGMRNTRATHSMPEIGPPSRNTL